MVAPTTIPRPKINPSGVRVGIGRIPPDERTVADYPLLAAELFDPADAKTNIDFGSKIGWRCAQDPSHTFFAWPRDRMASAATPAHSCSFCTGQRSHRSAYGYAPAPKKFANAPEIAADYRRCGRTVADIAHLAAEWHPRNARRADQVSAASNTARAWWLCDRGHEWEANVASRVKGNLPCRLCAADGVDPGEGWSKPHVVESKTIADYDHLVAEWHTDNDLSPKQVAHGRGDIRVKWRCQRGHAWSTTPASRARKGTGCPRCRLHGTSKVEIHLAFELASFLPIAVGDSRVEGWNCDIVCQDLRLVVEYDGARWHRAESNVERDRRKTSQLTAAGWIVIRVREQPLDPVGRNDIRVRPSDWATAAVEVARFVADGGSDYAKAAAAYAARGVPVAEAAARAWIAHHSG